jgi:UDP-galactopyranose mutase
MTRCARERRVFYVEEPILDADAKPYLEIERHSGVAVAVPHLRREGSEDDHARTLRALLLELIAKERIDRYVHWYYTPMALSFTSHMKPNAVVYDCMDELSAFAHAPAALRQREAELLRRAAVVFTGGQSLFEAKRGLHPNVHAFPSSVDVPHFARARDIDGDPPDQAAIPRPRLGFFGVIDERMDLDLVAGVAASRPDWSIVLLGPVVKIDRALLPRATNIYYPGQKSYEQLPEYIAGWDVAILPFARNDATRYISPTKTPEYMAAGKPVVSTSIRDVVRPYGQQGLVRIADTVGDFIAACEASLADDPVARRRDADAFLRQTSWDGTWTRMRRLIETALGGSVAPSGAAAAG